MATYTENYNLTLPEETDFYNVEDFNENFETIDTLMAENERAATEINEKIGTPENGETIFSLLKNSDISLIKSIQKVKYTIKKDTSSGSISITEVNPAKCIVIFERLYDYIATGCTKLDYTLTATSINVSHNSYDFSSIRDNLFGFWIIEFN